MGSNRHLISDKEAGLTKKLELMADNIRGSLKAQGFQTREQYLAEAIKILRSFYTTMESPELEAPLVRPDDLPDLEIFNEIWNAVGNDLVSVFSELENLGLLTVGNFNYVATESNRLTARLKAVSSKLGDYILYTTNPNRDSFYFKDSFNDLSKVNVDSDLLNAQECEVNKEEGIVLLPLDKSKEPGVIISKNPVINPNSNGVNGNNRELGKPYNGDISVVLDNNPDTWFEYERVLTGTSDTKEPLILDLTMVLDEETVINHIRVNPNNFGVKTAIKINEIETSLDGRSYISVKDDIPIAGFITEDEENIFQLAPSTSKFAGQGLYTFTPRKVRYIHLVFQQDEPYVISTSSGELLRYAIGLRDLHIEARKYQNIGELISEPFTTLDEIRKVLLETGQNPAQLSELASIDYSISPDDGGTWYDIQPKEIIPLSGIVSTPEILDFNGADPDTIKTAAPVKSVRLRIKLKRNDEAFDGDTATLRKTTLDASELHALAETSSGLTLDHAPIEGEVSVVDPLYGSRGIPRAGFILGYGGGDTRKFRLPIEEFPRPLEKTGSAGAWNTVQTAATNWMHVEVAGEEWTQAVSGIDNYGSNDKVFSFKPSEGILEFSPALGTGQLITFWLDAEKVFPSVDSDNHVFELDFHTSNNKSDFTLKSYAPWQQDTEILPYKASRISLKHQDITTTTDLASQLSTAGYSTERTFVNGRDEFQGSGEWSIDKTAGVLHLSEPTSAQTSYSIGYWYQPIEDIPEDSWEWVTDDSLNKKIRIREKGWRTHLVEEEETTLPANGYAFDLSKMHVVRDSFQYLLTSGTGEDVDSSVHPFLKETPFVNGSVEFGDRVKKKTEGISALTPVSDVATFTLNHPITTDTNYIIQFSNTDLFSTPVGGTPAAPGEYRVTRATGTVEVYTTTTVNRPGTITYYAEDSNIPDSGLFSIDYEKGIVYTQRPLDSTWVLKATFKYSDYRAEYKIARLLAPSSYELDVTTRTIRITDKEILDRVVSPDSGVRSQSYYLVNYKYVADVREDVEDLKDYFSPVLKDYALRVLTKGSIF